MGYKITLTESEERQTLEMEAKGYDCGFCDGMNESVCLINADGSATYEVPEHVMWSIQEQYEAALAEPRAPFGPFDNEHNSVIPKLHALMQEIV